MRTSSCKLSVAGLLTVVSLVVCAPAGAASSGTGTMRPDLAQTPSAGATASQGSSYILVFQRWEGSGEFGIGGRLGQGSQARNWMDQSLQPNDRVAVAVIQDGNLFVACDFSRDRTTLAAAIDDVVTGKPVPPTGCSPTSTAGASPAATAPAPGATLAAGLQAANPNHRPVNQADAVRMLAAAAAAIPAPKHLMLFMGFPDISWDDIALAKEIAPYGIDFQ